MVWLRKVHKWVGLLTGIQVLLWLLSGLVMSMLDPVKVSGRAWMTASPGTTPDLQGPVLEVGALPDAILEGAQSISLHPGGDDPVYRIRRAIGELWIDARSGTVLQFGEPEVMAIAVNDFSGNGEVVSVDRGMAPDLATRNHSGEYWRVDFSDPAATSIYVSAATGKVLERRNNYWRAFDLFWMLHIMDYTGRSDFNNSLIITTALVAIWLGLSGFLLLFGSFNRRDFALISRISGRETALVTLIDPAVSTPQLVRLRQGGNLFLSLAAANVTLPSNCGGGGSCGLCVVQMEASELNAPNGAERSLIPGHLLDQGFRLACQQAVDHSITLRLDEGTISAEGIEAAVRSTRMVTPFIKEILLECDRPLSFAAGSYFQVRIPAHKIHLDVPDLPVEYLPDWEVLDLPASSEAGSPLRRAYSAANYAGELDNHLKLNVRFQPPPKDQPDAPVGTGSAWMHSLEVGDELLLSGPHGHFQAQDTDREMVFIGGGAGMGPLRAIILDQLANKSSGRTISFWYGARNHREVFYQATFDRLASQHDNFSWTVALSEPSPGADWQGLTGYIHQVVLDQFLSGHPNIPGCEFYICGPPPMLMATLEMLAELGVAPEAIRYDDFGN